MSEQTSVETPQTSSVVQPSTPKKQKQRSGSGALGWFNFLLILALTGAVAAGGWFGWQHHHVLLAQLDYLKQNVVQQQNHEQQLQQALQNLQQVTATQAQELETLTRQNNYTADQLAKLAGADKQDWLVAEAEYLLRLANQRLQLERDWGSALAMLQAADSVLAETGNPRLASVRAHIADEMLALRQAPALDRQGAVLRLQSIQKAIPNLPWLPEKLASSAPEIISDVAANDTQPWYTQFWHTVKSSLTSLVRIRERSDISQAPLSPDQQYFLQQNMYLMLEQAQIAMLREEQALYTHSLQRVDEWIKTYLLVEDANTQAVEQSIHELLQWQVAPERPDISQSLVNLQKLVEQSRRGAVVGGDA